MSDNDMEVIRGSGNVFRDVGCRTPACSISLCPRLANVSKSLVAAQVPFISMPAFQHAGMLAVVFLIKRPHIGKKDAHIYIAFGGIHPKLTAQFRADFQLQRLWSAIFLFPRHERVSPSHSHPFMDHTSLDINPLSRDNKS